MTLAEATADDDTGDDEPGAWPRTSLTHYHATWLGGVGDIVMAVSRYVDPATLAPTRLELRVFAARTPHRNRIPQMAAEELLAQEGGLAYVAVELAPGSPSFPFDRPSRRIARITKFRLAGSTWNQRSGHVQSGLADWVRETLESELLLGLYVELRGDAYVFGSTGRGEVSWETWRDKQSDFGRWAADWLEEAGYDVSRQDPGRFAFALNPRFVLGGADDIEHDDDYDYDSDLEDDDLDEDSGDLDDDLDSDSGPDATGDSEDWDDSADDEHDGS